MAKAKPDRRLRLSGVVKSTAICRICGWHSTSRNSLGSAARHHDATGHTVDVEQVVQVTYGKRAALERIRAERQAPKK